MFGSYSSNYFRKIAQGSLNSARVIVPEVLALVPAQSVVDLGCGSGSWLKVFQECGVKKILGIDKNIKPEALLIAKENFLDSELINLQLNQTFDLAMSLEVGEHLKSEDAERLVESLVKLSNIVLFSAAQPFQGGHRHLNEQWPEYWLGFFKNRGYVVVDAIRKQVWNNPKVEWWYAQNILIFVKAEVLPQFPKLQEARKLTFENQLSLVHPKSLTIRKVIKAFLSLFLDALKRKLWPKSQS